MLALPRVERVSSGRIAGNDDRLHVLRGQEVRDLAAVASDRVRTLRAVRNARRIAEVDHTFVRELLDQLADNGQATDAGIENADG